MRKRVFLDEQLTSELGAVFGTKAHVYTVNDFGISGAADPRVIDQAVAKKCLIVTANADFVEYYRNHIGRKSGAFYYGLIYLHASGDFTRKMHLEKALKETAWIETRRHDDLITVFSDGRTRHERLCHPGCAAEFKDSNGS